MSIQASADTRFFKSFEMYSTDSYDLSTDGYAIIDVPDYMKSGYYFLNNSGLVKFLNIDRGNDESSINLTTPYYYLDKDSKNILTYYEWQEKNGKTTNESKKSAKDSSNDTKALGNEDPTEIYELNIDTTQDKLEALVQYKYTEDKYKSDAKKSGKFPRVTLVSPTNDIYNFETTQDLGRQASGNLQKSTKTDDSKETTKPTSLACSVTGATAGNWTIKFYNFNYITKNLTTNIVSGNATSFIHAGNGKGNISIYYDASPDAHDMSVTWVETSRAAVVTVTDPNGKIYSKEKTPGNVMLDQYGKFIIKLPNIIAGKYKIEVQGEELGRVWVDCKKSVKLENTQPQPESSAEGSTTASAETSAANASSAAEQGSQQAHTASTTAAASAAAVTATTAQ